LPDIDRIATLAPFGERVAAATEPSPATAGAPLDIALRGVLVDPDPAQSRAFLSVAGATAVFRLGETVSTAELVAINTDTVTLSRGGTLLIVGFDGIQGSQDNGPVAAQTPPADEGSDPFARLAAMIVPGNGSIDLRDMPAPETTGDYISLWRDRITQNPQAAMDSVGVELVENGYRIKADPDIGVTLAGLKAGDVITRLNGEAVGDLNSDKQLYDDVAASGIARLEVVRNGQALLLTFPLR
jgi:general secretion pathway protein C